MIDWWSIAAHGTWILGLSLMLSAYGYRRWLARQGSPPVAFSQPPWLRFAWTSGILLACLGWGLGRGARWWERVLWIALAAGFTREWLGSASTFLTRFRRGAGRARSAG